MNFGEEIAYWYLRLNGFFPITNFVVHRFGENPQPTDCDVLAIRLPCVYEEIGGQDEDWDPNISSWWNDNKIVGVICEVKAGKAYSNIFPEHHVIASMQRLGFTPKENVLHLFPQLHSVGKVDIEGGYRIVKLLIANFQQQQDNVYEFVNLSSALEFIKERIKKYPQKGSDWHFFNSNIIQKLIWDNKTD